MDFFSFSYRGRGFVCISAFDLGRMGMVALGKSGSGVLFLSYIALAYLGKIFALFSQGICFLFCFFFKGLGTLLYPGLAFFSCFSCTLLFFFFA